MDFSTKTRTSTPKGVGSKRPKIPTPTQVQLWVQAGGRCEFPGCNAYLLRDDLTFTEGNYSNIAHIISWIPTGPRGDKELSPILATNISNLMLMCKKHAGMIDVKKNIPQYTVAYLQQCKTEHEGRIALQTSIDVSRKTTVVRLQSNIRGRLVEVPYLDAYSALIASKRYPNDDKGILIDLTVLNYGSDSTAWEIAKRTIDTKLDKGLAVGNDGLKSSHLSIFGLAPIPVLAYLGFRLGNTIPAEIYIKTRGMPWSLNSGEPQLTLKTSHLRRAPRAKKVALSIAISGTTSTSEIEKHLGKAPIFTIRSQSPGLDQIRYIEELEHFRKVYRNTIDAIREQYGKQCEIHVFGAMPTCAAVVCGRELVDGVDPVMVMYEHLGQEEGLIPALTFNNIKYGN
jgi:hypothetical protein